MLHVAVASHLLLGKQRRNRKSGERWGCLILCRASGGSERRAATSARYRRKSYASTFCHKNPKLRRDIKFPHIHNPGEMAAETRSSQAPTSDRSPLLFDGTCRASWLYIRHIPPLHQRC